LLQDARRDRQLFRHAPPDERADHAGPPVHLIADAAGIDERLADRLEALEVELAEEEVGAQLGDVGESDLDVGVPSGLT
jgi:hypothetical protein